MRIYRMFSDNDTINNNSFQGNNSSNFAQGIMGNFTGGEGMGQMFADNSAISQALPDIASNFSQPTDSTGWGQGMQNPNLASNVGGFLDNFSYPSGHGNNSGSEAQRQTIEGIAPQITGQSDMANAGLQVGLTGVLGRVMDAPVNAQGLVGALNPSSVQINNGIPGSIAKNTIFRATPGNYVGDLGAESLGYSALNKGLIPSTIQQQSMFNELSPVLNQFKPGGMLSGMASPNTINTLQNYLRHGAMTNKVQDALRLIRPQ